MRRALAVVVVAGALVVGAPSVGLLEPAGAQPAPSGEVPTQDIVPQPNSGEAPDEAGDRGGALQLLLLALVVVAIAGVATHLARQSRRFRDDYSNSAAQAEPPSRNPSR